MAKRKSTIVFEDIRDLILEARTAVAQSANLVQVWTNFQIGFYPVSVIRIFSLL